MQNDSSNDAVYDLQGRRVAVKGGSELPKGIYIKNGKKVLGRR